MFCPKCGSENLDTSRFCKKCGKNLPDRSQIRQVATEQFSYAMPPTINLLGQVLDGKYRIEAKLGSGGMGDVYRATRLLIGDTVAIKILHTHLARDAQAAERFRREAVTATQLRHKNIVALYDVGISTAHNVPFILMELAEGFSLRQIINQYRVLPLDFIVTVTAQVCAALDEAHRLGIVHRDIKPENIIANQTANGWHVKVLDFGIAKLYNQADSGLTQDGSAMGTPQYMSPEQCLGEPLDGRSDLYSVGILLYEMMAGTVPFKSPVASAIAVHQVQTPPIPPRSLNPNIAPQVELVILRLLDKRREMRPQTASQLAREMIQAATIAFKAGLTDVSAMPISAPNVKPEFDSVGEIEIEKTPTSHLLSSEILVGDESNETALGESSDHISEIGQLQNKIKLGKKRKNISNASISEATAQKDEPENILEENPEQSVTEILEVSSPHFSEEILVEEDKSLSEMSEDIEDEYSANKTSDSATTAVTEVFEKLQFAENDSTADVVKLSNIETDVFNYNEKTASFADLFAEETKQKPTTKEIEKIEHSSLILDESENNEVFSDISNMSLVFEDAEHILDELFPDEKKQDNQSIEISQPTEIFEISRPISVPNESLPEFENSSSDVLAKFKAETVFSNEAQDQKSENSFEIGSNESVSENFLTNQIISLPKESVSPTKTPMVPETQAKTEVAPVFSPEIQSGENSKKPLIFAAIGIFSFVFLAGAAVFGLWFFSGNKPTAETISNSKSDKNVNSLSKTDQNTPPAGMAYVTGGEFMIGSDTGDEYSRPAHKVSVKPFFIDLTEVTNEDYKKFVDAANQKPPPGWSNNNFPEGKAKFPVTGVDWDDASAYAKWAGKRLPTEEEWEFAARGTDNRIYPWGNDWKKEFANADKQTNGMTEVGKFMGKSPFGLSDMSGNAWEWTATDAKAYPNGKSFVSELVEPKIIRGGYWGSGKDVAAAYGRRAYGARDEAAGYGNTSFRCVKDI